MWATALEINSSSREYFTFSKTKQHGTQFSLSNTHTQIIAGVQVNWGGKIKTYCFMYGWICKSMAFLYSHAGSFARQKVLLHASPSLFTRVIAKEEESRAYPLDSGGFLGKFFPL